MADLYYDLVATIDEYNRSYGLQLLMVHLGSSCVTIFSGFAMYRVAVDMNRESIYTGVNYLCWSIFYSIYQLRNTLLGGMVRTQSLKRSVLKRCAMSPFLVKLRRHDTIFDILWIGHWFSNRFGLSPLVYRESGELPTFKRVPYSMIVAALLQMTIFVTNLKFDFAKIHSNSFIMSNGMRYTLNLLGHEMDMKSQNRWFNMLVMFTSTLLIFVLVIAGFLTYHAIDESVLAFIAAYCSVSFTNIMITTISGQHYIVQYSIQYRFKELNRYLCELLPTEMEQSNNFRLFYVSKNRAFLLIRVVKIADLHHDLAKLIDEYNANFGLQLLMTHLGSTCVTIFSGFTLYRALVDMSSESIYISINNMCWSFYYAVYQILNTVLGEMVRSQSKQMGKLLHKAIALINDEEIRDQLLHFSNQISQRSSIISCKWFDFDNALIFSTMGAITTYLVILIQFDVTSQQA
ncbi:uncharacterized protein LOC129728970 [Wyeomyia smithii]|uniref:uncharacterized protein LOC129728970 n=1 Tax=Wyeomyia smithii TaxID=174621 RepID=UPI0024680ED6|nr:uncharacterized protein LOC129728970 [Wyeomyia smithii]